MFKETNIYEGYSKSEFKTLVSLSSKESYFFFNEILYKHKNAVAMVSPLGPGLAKAWSRNHTNNFKFKNCSFGATNIGYNSDKEKYVFSGYEITFDSVSF